MIELKNSGLDLRFDEKTFKLSSKSKKIRISKPGVRTLKQARKFLMDPKATTADGKENLYYMYRDVCSKDDKALLQQNKLRYDITIIPANKIGDEFTKTVGHYHPFVKGESVTYPEIYEVLHGTAHCLLQKKDIKGSITEARLIIAEKDDKVLIPPNFGHVTINAGTEPLVMSNLVEMSFSSEYGDFKKKSGAMYYGIDVNGHIRFVPNKKYKEHPKLKIIKNKEMPGMCLKKNLPLYTAGITFPKKFGYLVRPQDCKDRFK